MANHENRPIVDKVDLLLAFKRKSKKAKTNNKCIRMIVRNFEQDLIILESRLKILGGVWRIHQTVNKRDVHKARNWLLHKLIDTNQFDGCLDSLWRTALLQSGSKAENNFMLDSDTKNENELKYLNPLIINKHLFTFETPNGFHIITKPFDTREICKLPYVTLIRDGYYFIKEIK